MKKLIVFMITGILLGVLPVYGQQELSILKADDSWGKEIIKFPIDWAPKVTLEGFEELRFAPNWKDQNNEQFWTLVMAWELRAEQLLTKDALSNNLLGYFDGLMKPNHWSKKFPDPKLSFSEISKDKNKLQLTGNMTFFDGFHTGKTITVHIKAEETFDKDANKATVIFRLSPQPFDHAIWDGLLRIQAKVN